MNTQTKLPQDHPARMARARQSLEGLSIGDAFGEGFFGNTILAMNRLQYRQEPPPPWFWTDDTAMATSILRCLDECGEIERDHLADLFAQEYARDPKRGYGGTAHSILRAIGEGICWQKAAGNAFDGMGSMGNGGAMRAAPIGAYFADDITRLIENARYSAEVTHAHVEGQAGAIAIALAAAWAWNARNQEKTAIDARVMLEFAMEHTPESTTKYRIRRALDIPFDRLPQTVGAMIGNGSKVTAEDTVPFALWCAARHPDNFTEALWATASAFGDTDTNCAIVGGIVVLASGESAIPEDWRAAREPLRI